MYRVMLMVLAVLLSGCQGPTETDPCPEVPIPRVCPVPNA